MTDVDTTTEAVERRAKRLASLPFDMTVAEFDAVAATLRALAAERDALTTHRGYVTCVHCGGQNGFLEADVAAEVERRAEAARDAARAECVALASRVTEAQAQVARMREAIQWALGEGDSDFADHMPADKAPRFWWRAELRRRVALTEAPRHD
jgi:hypothetical protein